jgi:hypothetical protein
MTGSVEFVGFRDMAPCSSLADIFKHINSPAQEWFEEVTGNQIKRTHSLRRQKIIAGRLKYRTWSGEVENLEYVDHMVCCCDHCHSASD